MNDQTKDRLKWALEWAYCIIIAVVLALLVRYFVGTPTIVQQPSMLPTLKPNQRLILNRLPRTFKKMPERGDIITFEAPNHYVTSLDIIENNYIARYDNEPQGILGKFRHYVLETEKTSYIKRVIALPGETVKIQEGKVYINGELFSEPYLAQDVETASENLPFTDITVPENCVFVMGDNRPQSVDSRKLGCIPLEKIESKVLVRIWPLNVFGKVE